MEPTAEEIAARAALLAKAAGTPDAIDQFTEEAKLLLIGEAEAASKAVGGEQVADEATAAAAAAAGTAEGAAAVEGGEGEVAAVGEAAAPAKEAGAVAGEETPPVDGAVRKARRKEIGDTLTQVWQSPDGRTFATKDAALDALEAEPPIEESAVEKALRVAREAGTVEAAATAATAADDLAQVGVDLDTAHKGLLAANEHLAPLLKGLYEVRSLTSVLQEMSWIVSCVREEATREGDGSTVPAQLYAATRQLGAALITMAQEEVAEMLTLLGAGSDWADAAVPIADEVITIVELAAIVDMTKANEAVMEKAGRRNSKADASKIQTVHDHAVALGATCEAAKAAGAGEPADGENDVVKGLRAENERLSGEVTKAVEGIGELGERLATMAAQVEKMGKSPAPLPPRSDHIVVDRGGGPQKITEEDLSKMTADERLDLVVRIQQMNPVHVG